MGSYAWIIDEDHEEKGGEFDAAGTIGPREATDADMKRLEKGEGQEFRILCDEELVYSGRLVGEDVTLFEPLDDFGGPNFGCNTIQYKQNGRWEDL